MMLQCAGEGTSQAIVFTLVNSLEVIFISFICLFWYFYPPSLPPSFLPSTID